MNFHHRAITVIFTIMYSVCSLGQIGLGGKIGYSHTHTANAIRGKSYDSFNGGLTSSWKVSNVFHVNGDILFTGRGYEVDNGVYDEVSSTYKDCKVRFKYIDIPILLEYNINHYVSLEIGPYVGVQILRKLYYDNEEQNKNLLGKKQSFDMGLLAGIKGKYKGIFIEVLYQKGMTQAFKDVDGFESKGVCINMGYLINLK